MQHFGDPAKQPLDQDDLLSRIREIEQLASKIEPELDKPQKALDFAFWVQRYALVGVEIKRILMHAEEILEEAAGGTQTPAEYGNQAGSTQPLREVPTDELRNRARDLTPLVYTCSSR